MKVKARKHPDYSARHRWIEVTVTADEVTEHLNRRKVREQGLKAARLYAKQHHMPLIVAPLAERTTWGLRWKCRITYGTFE